MVGEVLQPSLHRTIRGWTGEQAREEYKNDVLRGKQSDDMRDASAQHLANADFFGTAHHGQHRQPEDAEAGDADRKKRSVCGNSAEPLLRPVKSVDVFIQEVILEWKIRSKFGPCILEECYHLRDIVRTDFDQQGIDPVRIEPDGHRHDGVV